LNSRLLNICCCLLFTVSAGLFDFTLTAGSVPETDSIIHTNFIFKENIKTVLLHKEGWVLSYPIIELNTDNRLELSFDDISNKTENYYYTFIHCDYDWNPSSLFPSDFLDGFTENQISDYSFSFNTTVDYVHYRQIFPNENVQFRISGNYILKVYQDYDQNNLVLTRRFTVTENQVEINVSPKRPMLEHFREKGQEIDFAVNYEGYSIRDPYMEIKVVISQNNRYDNLIKGFKPSFQRQSQLVFDYSSENVFPGGNEYRYFDIKSLRYQSEFVEHIDFVESNYHIALYSGKPKFNQAYFYDDDLNGRFYIDVQEGRKSEIEADYVYVYFTLPYDFPLTKGNVYVFGALSDWTCNETNRMKYNPESGSYELRMLLKQGFYNYEYVFVHHGLQVADNTIIEGSHYETENDYIVYVYHRNPITRFDKLIGLEIVNTLRK
jgi:hypothetical protein